MENVNYVKGYKVFDTDWNCNTKQYSCPGKFEMDNQQFQHGQGMHFCKNATDCFNYIHFNIENKVAEVVAYGDIVKEGDIYCTDKLEVISEISWMRLLEIVSEETGVIGNSNRGNYNSGAYNRGDSNTGNDNTGNYNSGNRNTGDYNTGKNNSGHYNSGHYNSGNYNSGSYNCGTGNKGYNNNGNYNIGDWNTGDWNKCSFSSGCFNTIDTKIHMFDKPSEWTYKDWINSEACHLLSQIPGDIVDYVKEFNMTEEEKKEYPESQITGGYLKVADRSNNAIIWWHNLTDNEKEIIKSIPNFDRGIFKEITGIDTDNSQ